MLFLILALKILKSLQFQITALMFPCRQQKNIAVNCVTPAAAKTRIFDQMTEEHINYMLSKIPRNKFAKVEELASLVTWLASEENSFSTAAVFDLSGGRATY